MQPLTVRVEQLGAAAAGSMAAAAVVQSLMSNDYGLPTPNWREHVNA